MSLIDLTDLDHPDEAIRATVEAGRAAYGGVLETWRAIAHAPAVFNAYLPYVRAVFGEGALDRRIKDLVAIRVCILNRCRYSLSHRVASARLQGIPEADIVGLADPDAHSYSAAEHAALAFADELTLEPSRVPGDRSPVSDATIAAVKSHFDDPQINDLATSVAIWNMLTRYHRVLDLDLDMPPPPPEIDPVSGD